MTQLVRHCLSGDFAAARVLQRKFLPLMDVNFVESNPIPVKWAVQRMGLIGPGIRLPLLPLAPQYHATVLEAMTAASVSVAAA